MKSENLNAFNTLSNLVGKGKNLVVQSTRMDFETNTYISELWKRGNGEWKKFKSGDSNFSCLLYTSPSPRDLSTSRMPSSA